MIIITKEDGSYKSVSLKNKYVNQAIDLYKQTFNDSDSFIKIVMEKVKAVSIDIGDNQVVSCAFYREKHILENKKKIKTPFIFGVATNPNYRHQQRAHKVINGLLNYIKEKGYDMAFLAPANKGLYAFYSQFGFEKYSFFEYKKGRIEDKYVVKQGSVEDAEIIMKLFNKNANRLENCQIRNKAETETKLKEVEADGGKIMLALNNKKVIGYYFEDGDIIESIGIDWIYGDKGNIIVIPTNKYIETSKCPGIVIKKFDKTKDKTGKNAYFYDMY